MTEKRQEVEYTYSEEFEAKVGIHLGSALSPLLFAIATDANKKCKRI